MKNNHQKEDNVNKSKVLQDAFLEQLKKENTPVSIYLINGIKLQGTIDSFDQYVVLLKSSSIIQSVYKHAISTIVPSKLIDFRTDNNKDINDNE